MSQKTLAKRPTAPAQTTAPKPRSRVRYWVKEGLTTAAVLVIVLLVISGSISEDWIGIILGGIAVGGAVYLTAVPVAEESQSRKTAIGIYGFGLLWILAAYMPFISMIMPGTPVQRVDLPSEGAEKNIGKLDKGRYQIVEYLPRSAVAAEMDYVLSVSWPGGEEKLAGKFTRTQFQGRRGKVRSASVHSSNRDEVSIGGGETKVRLDSVKGGMSAPMSIAFYRRWIPYGAWMVLEILVLLGAALLDARFADRKRRSTLTIGACFTLVFVELARQSVSPMNVKRPLFGAVIGAFIAAALGGYLLNTIARHVAGRIRRRAAA